ncbi:MAG: hypothetical protein ACLPUO_07925 [Streptosporangiaceae bacterium]
MAQDDRGRKVVIENQFGPTDHGHFGQVVLYACEARADVLVWLATDAHRRFIPHGARPEHRRALARLNQVFAGQTELFGVELAVESESLPIGEPPGPPMPRLRVVVKPDNA